MKLDEFITEVLVSINNGLLNAKEKTGKEYSVQLGNDNNNGVNFDIAVTTSNISSVEAEGTAKVGIIEVLGAGVGAKLDSKSENEEVSRISFRVKVPKI